MTRTRMAVLLVVVAVTIGIALGLAGCAKAPPDQKALLELAKLAKREAPAALRQTGASKGDSFDTGGVYIAKSGSPATVVLPVEFRKRLDVQSPVPGMSVFQTTSKAYLVVEYKWTGKRWKRMKAEVMDEYPGHLPEWVRHR
jgi:hypothetical protein